MLAEAIAATAKDKYEEGKLKLSQNGDRLFGGELIGCFLQNQFVQNVAVNSQPCAHSDDGSTETSHPAGRQPVHSYLF